MLQIWSTFREVVYISLDTFKKRGYNKISNKLEAWLSFFTYEQPEEIISLVNSFPEFAALYKDIAEFRRKPEEVIGMFSEALRIMDHNTTKYMIEDLQRQYEEAVAKRDEAETKLDETEMKLGEAETKLGETEMKLDETEMKLDEAVAERDEANAKIATKACK
jgi:chromosome segregation ATPase